MFGNSSKKEICKGDFYYFIDCLFRGICKAFISDLNFSSFINSFNDSVFNQSCGNASKEDSFDNNETFDLEFSRGKLYRMRSKGTFYFC